MEKLTGYDHHRTEQIPKELFEIYEIAAARTDNVRLVKLAEEGGIFFGTTRTDGMSRDFTRSCDVEVRAGNVAVGISSMGEPTEFYERVELIKELKSDEGVC